MDLGDGPARLFTYEDDSRNEPKRRAVNGAGAPKAEYTRSKPEGPSGDGSVFTAGKVCISYSRPVRFGLGSKKDA